jgi:hypothetical protein
VSPKIYDVGKYPEKPGFAANILSVVIIVGSSLVSRGIFLVGWQDRNKLRTIIAIGNELLINMVLLIERLLTFKT